MHHISVKAENLYHTGAGSPGIIPSYYSLVSMYFDNITIKKDFTRYAQWQFDLYWEDIVKCGVSTGDPVPGSDMGIFTTEPTNMGMKPSTFGRGGDT